MCTWLSLCSCALWANVNMPGTFFFPLPSDNTPSCFVRKLRQSATSTFPLICTFFTPAPEAMPGTDRVRHPPLVLWSSANDAKSEERTDVRLGPGVWCLPGYTLATHWGMSGKHLSLEGWEGERVLQNQKASDKVGWCLWRRINISWTGTREEGCRVHSCWRQTFFFRSRGSSSFEKAADDNYSLLY